jgi:ERF superfamily
MTEGKDGAALAAALAAFQAEVPAVSKTKTAEVQGTTRSGDRYKYTYRYADLADVTAAVLPLLGKNGLSFTARPTLLPDNTFVLIYRLMHSSGEYLEGCYLLDASLPPQQIGSAITYARRYTLCAVTGIAAEEDDDAAGAQAEHGKSPARQGVTVTTAPQASNGEAVTPEVQALAIEAFAMVSVDQLAKVYENARAHRGWLSAPVLHPTGGQPTVLSAVIRERKVWLESQAEVQPELQPELQPSSD